MIRETYTNLYVTLLIGWICLGMNCEKKLVIQIINILVSIDIILGWSNG